MPRTWSKPLSSVAQPGSVATASWTPLAICAPEPARSTRPRSTRASRANRAGRCSRRSLRRGRVRHVQTKRRLSIGRAASTVIRCVDRLRSRQGCAQRVAARRDRAKANRPVASADARIESRRRADRPVRRSRRQRAGRVVQHDAADRASCNCALAGRRGEAAQQQCKESVWRTDASRYFTSTISMASRLGPSIMTARKPPSV